MKLRCLIPSLVLLLVIVTPTESNGQALFDLETSEGYVPVDDSLRLYYRAIGSSQDTVVVLHGGPGMPSAYIQPDLRPLALSNTLLFYDQRSAGESTLVTDTTRLHLRDYVRDLEALRRHFGMEQMTLLGHSWGPYIMAAYAMEHPERVERMLLVDPGPPAADPYLAQVDIMSRLDSLSAAKAAQAYERWGATPDTTKQCWAYYSQAGEGFTSDPSYVHQMWGDPCNAPQATKLNPHTYHPRNVLFDPPSGEFDWTDELAQITAPTLIIHGQDDPWPVEGGRHWAEALSNAQFVVVEDAGHFPYVEQPQEFFPVAKAFLDGAWPVQTQEAARAWPPAPEEAGGDYARVWWEITAAHDRLEAAFDAQDAARTAEGFAKTPCFSLRQRRLYRALVRYAPSFRTPSIRGSGAPTSRRSTSKEARTESPRAGATRCMVRRARSSTWASIWSSGRRQMAVGRRIATFSTQAWRRPRRSTNTTSRSSRARWYERGSVRAL